MITTGQSGVKAILKIKYKQNIDTSKCAVSENNS
jgi:hypothetical protein